MKLNEIVAPSMKTLFVKEVESWIISGQVKIGDQLPTEREMSEQMKISRTITNAGLNELARKGFIEIIPRKGTFVADYKRNGTFDALVSIIRFNGGKFDQKTFHSLLDFRLAIESATSEAAAKNRTEADIERLQACYEQILLCETVQEVALAKMKFHHEVACASGNIVYPLVMNAFQEVNTLFTEAVYNIIGTEEVSKYLLELIEAIKVQDAELSKEVMLRLLSESIDELKQKYFD